ncbi:MULTISPECIES: site-specific recombinase [unclassified Microcoleus]|uniref:site-specific recombinase n=1 Tax=unclassified Microcoleus TaxID=2642155 RepID=UPI0025F7DC00|nr:MULTISPECIES: site-specific recombinase [unclassified Microcoleus]
MAKTGVAIVQKCDRLYLQATLPPRPASDKALPYQQQIALGVHANPAGISLAEKEARRLGFLIDSKSFDWGLYGDTNQKIETITDLAQKFEEMKRHDVSDTTWETDYARPLAKLPAGEQITPELLIATIAETKPNTRQRRRFCLAFRQLAQFAGIDIDVSDLMGNYSPTKVQPRNLPTDEDIAKGFAQIENLQWQWVYGVIAAYGLRDHEAFYLDMSKFPIAQVLEGKTGYRQCWPLRPEWAEQWDLVNVKRPPVTGRCHADFGDRVCKFFSRSLIDFRAYDLRHAWAIRAIGFGLDTSLAAKQMGHSLATHTQTYHLALNEREQQRAYDRILSLQRWVKNEPPLKGK